MLVAIHDISLVDLARMSGRPARATRSKALRASATDLYHVTPQQMDRMMHEYGDDFYAFLSTFAVRSARRVVPVVPAATSARSVVDFGCGHGASPSESKAAGPCVPCVNGPV